jgi:hypothetical protein
MRQELVDPRIKKLLLQIKHFESSSSGKLNEKIKVVPCNWNEFSQQPVEDAGC